MEIMADLQVHSRHARATSSKLSIENLEKYGKIKGLDLIGTGDFQHPLHRKEIDEKLTENENGILKTKNGFSFLWQTEISLIYSKEGRRAIHLLVFAPDAETADGITEFLGKRGRLDYDGRPIFGMTCPEFTEEMKKINEKIEIIPAHCMTPWFGLFGSKSGFDSLKDCFEEQTRHIHAVESGMSADPEMLWRFREIASGKINVVSFSDAHSFWPWRLGRESTIFEIPELTYDDVIKAIRTGRGLKATIETPPSYGKYHWDGHRACGFSCSPEKTRRLKGTCPECKKPLTIGVDYRVEEIAEKPKGFTPPNPKPFHRLLPLHELIALNLNSSLSSNRTWRLYDEMIENFGNEFNVLMKTPKERLLKIQDDKLAELVMKNREDGIKIKPGYDGEYGKVMLGEKQKTLM